MPETIHIYVGVDRSQMLACSVLEHSIQRHTRATVQVVPMLDLPIPLPKDPKNYPRTGFSFTRFCIPKLAGYQGRAIYMDADMMVFQDIQTLWHLPMNGASIMIQSEQTVRGSHGQAKKKRQCSVMMLDCAALDWDVKQIVQDLDAGRYTYSELMSELCLVSDDAISTQLPDVWNHLDQRTDDTCLLHFTNMHRQPWMSPFHHLAQTWFDEVRLMLANGSLTWARIQNDIDEGYLRPSLIRDIQHGHKWPRGTRWLFNTYNHVSDYLKGFRKHKVFYQLLQDSRAASRNLNPNV
ncbi:MAG: glycosyltransferase [Formosimonas sp.]